MDRTRIALITGVSPGGTGFATAQALVDAGWQVYAAARRPQALAHLAARGALVLELDVTDEASLKAAIRRIEVEHSRLDALVNNAAIGLMGPVEEVTLDRMRRQFETNVFGLVRATQLVLPLMRAHGGGRIINLSSMGGEFTTPFAGFYHASKYAVESLSDALRVEVAPFGIEVVVIQPGGIDTPLAAGTVNAIPDSVTGAYTSSLAAFRQVSQAAAAMHELMVTPEQVAAVIVEAITAAKPLSRYKINPSDTAIINHQRDAADRRRDAQYAAQWGLPA